jgi:hypothetical protein
MTRQSVPGANVSTLLSPQLVVGWNGKHFYVSAHFQANFSNCSRKCQGQFEVREADDNNDDYDENRGEDIRKQYGNGDEQRTKVGDKGEQEQTDEHSEIVSTCLCLVFCLRTWIKVINDEGGTREDHTPDNTKMQSQDDEATFFRRISVVLRQSEPFSLSFHLNQYTTLDLRKL